MILTKYRSALLLTIALYSLSSSQANATTSLTPSASSDSLILQQILAVVSNIQTNFPIYLTQMSNLSLSALNPDTSPETAQAQNQFTLLANGNAANAATQLTTMQQQLLPSFFQNINSSAPTDKTPASYPYTIVNDLTYPTLLGQWYANPDPRQSSNFMPPASYNYILNASALNITHVPPAAPWDPAQGSRTSNKLTAYQNMYANYYKTTSSIQTFNAYVLSSLYAESQNNYPAMAAQNNLIQQATSSKWFTTIASEELGAVVRQILLYTSQTYVLLTQMVSVQKQTLTALVMTNALLVAGNQSNERMLYNTANGSMPPLGGS